MAKLLEITGKAISGEWGQDDDTGTGIPVLRTTNFTNEGFVNYKNVVTRSISKKNITEKYLRHGDIIIEKSGGSDKQPVGRVIFFEGEENKYLFNNFTGLLRVQNPEEWLPKYVFYALYAYYRNGGTRAFENRTTGLHNLQVDNYVKSVDIPKLSYRKQQHICETLDHVHDAISYRERQLTKLDELVKARFVEMFGDPIQNEKCWEIKSLFDLGYCKNGMNFHKGDHGVEIHCLGVGDFKDRSTIHQVENLPFVALNESPDSDYLLQDGDIVFVRSNGNKELVGRCLAIYPANVPVTYSGFCIRYRLTSEEASVAYLLRVLKADSVRKKMAGRGANIQNLNQQTLSQLAIPLPPLSLQNQFADFVAEVDKSKVEVQKALDQTQLLFDSLMQQYFG